MFSVDRIAEEILDREGGLVDDPDDSGGITNHGVSLATLRRLRRDIDGDGTVGPDDVRALDRAEAGAILVEQHYRRPGIDRLPEMLRAQMFDMHVNAGAAAVRILQRLLGEMGQPVAVDGIIGPQTQAAAALAARIAPDHLGDAYGIARRNWYYRLADRRPGLRKFACRRDGGKGGWIVRAESFIAPRYRLSEDEHRARVAGWARPGEDC